MMMKSCAHVIGHLLGRLARTNLASHAPSAIAVAGLAFEARIAGGITIINHGRQTSDALRAAIRSGSGGITSFGIAGGLVPGLALGQWVVASSIATNDQHYPVDQRWSKKMLMALPDARHAIIAGVDAPVIDPTSKRRLHEQTGAIVVDMESHLAARMVAEHDLPFAAFRVMLDAAHRLLPPAALVNLTPEGAPNLASVLRSIVRKPGQLPALMRLAIEASTAASALRRGRARLGLNFALPGSHLPEGFDGLSLVAPDSPASRTEHHVQQP